MHGYKLNFIDGEQQVRRVVDMFCEDDTEAVTRALRRADGVRAFEQAELRAAIWEILSSAPRR